MARAALTMHFGRGPEPSHDLRDWFDDDDRWMIGGWLDNSFRRAPTTLPWLWAQHITILDGWLLPSWYDHIWRNGVAWLYVYRAIERAAWRYIDAYYRWANLQSPFESAVQWRFGMRLVVRLPRSLSPAAHRRSESVTSLRLGFGAARRVGFGAPRQLRPVKESLFWSGALMQITAVQWPSWKSVDVKSCISAHLRHVDSVFEWPHWPIDDGGVISPSDLEYGWGVSVSILPGRMPAAQAGEFAVWPVPPPDTLHSARVEPDGRVSAVALPGALRDHLLYAVWVERPDGTFHRVEAAPTYGWWAEGYVHPGDVVGYSYYSREQDGWSLIRQIDVDEVGIYRLYLDVRLHGSLWFGIYESADNIPYVHYSQPQAKAMFHNEYFSAIRGDAPLCDAPVLMFNFSSPDQQISINGLGVASGVRRYLGDDYFVWDVTLTPPAILLRNPLSVEATFTFRFPLMETDSVVSVPPGTEREHVAEPYVRTVPPSAEVGFFIETHFPVDLSYQGKSMGGVTGHFERVFA